MIPAGNIAKRLSSVNDTTKTQNNSSSSSSDLCYIAFKKNTLDGELVDWAVNAPFYIGKLNVLKAYADYVFVHSIATVWFSKKCSLAYFKCSN